MIQPDSNYKLFIDGRWVDATGGKTFKATNPANGELLATCQDAAREDVDLAVKAAWKAFEGWKKVSPQERSGLLLKIADLIDANAERLAMVETLDNGKPIRETMAIDVPLSSDHFRYFAAAIRTEEGEAAMIDANTMSLILHEPIGVVGQIIPWNFPLLMGAWKIAPALAAGDTVVIKPSSTTSLSLLELAKLLNQVLPPGVVNVITGRGSASGQFLLDHPDLRKLGFTGSTEVGYTIADAAARKLIPATLELGGKSANIFFPDAPWEKAIEGVQIGILFNQGQVCCAGSRVFVHESIYDTFLAECVAAFNKVKVGLPWEKDTQMGAIVNAEQLQKILAYVEIGQGGGRPARLRRQAAHRRRTGQGQLHAADHPGRRQQQDAGGPGGDLRAGGDLHQVPHRGGRDRHGQRQRVRPGRRGVDPGHQPGPAGGQRRRDRAHVGEQLQQPARPRPLRRLQEVRHRPGDPQDDPGAPDPEEEHLHQHDRDQGRALLTPPAGARGLRAAGLRACHGSRRDHAGHAGRGGHGSARRRRLVHPQRGVPVQLPRRLPGQPRPAAGTQGRRRSAGVRGPDEPGAAAAGRLIQPFRSKNRTTIPNPTRSPALSSRASPEASRSPLT